MSHNKIVKNDKRVIYLLDIYKQTKDEKIKKEIIDLSMDRIMILTFNMHSKTGIDYDILFEIVLNSFEKSIELFDKEKNIVSFIDYSRGYIRRALLKYTSSKEIKTTEKIMKSLLENYKETKDISLRNKMIEINLDIVKDLAQKYENENIDDLENILAIKLIKCVDSYISGNINIYFRIYARNSLTSLMETLINKNQRAKQENNISLNTPDKQEEKLIGTSIIRNSVDTLNIDFSDIAKEILKTLNEKERRIIKMYYGISPYRKHTLVEIAKEYNVSRQRITQIIETRLEKIKNILISNNYNPFQIKNETLRVVEAQELLNDEIKLINKL